MDDFIEIDVMCARAAIIANLAATADDVADGDLRSVLVRTMETLLESIQPQKPASSSASITRIK